MDNSSIVLEASLRQGSEHPFLPEQAASFTLAMRNTTDEKVKVYSIALNEYTPLLNVLNSDGQLIGEFSPQIMVKRLLHVAIEKPGPVKSIELDSGADETTWVNLWNYAPPLEPGQYAFEFMHRLQADTDRVLSNRVPFQIVAAQVKDVALGYESSHRNTSVMAWLAAPEGNRDEPVLLARLSTGGDHRVTKQGATSYGCIPSATSVAVGQIPPDREHDDTGWIAVMPEGQAELIRHDMTNELWRSGLIPMNITDSKLINRYPDRGHAVLLATGQSEGKSVLAGVIVNVEQEGDYQPWSVPLLASPDDAVCCFGTEGPISLLFVSRDGENTNLSRLDVEQDGRVVVPEKIIHTTSLKVLSVAVDMRPGQTAMFLVLTADRDNHDHLSLIRIPLSEGPQVPELQPVAGWPATEDGDKRVPLEADRVFLELAPDGVAWLALIDEKGDFYGGTLTNRYHPVKRLRESSGTRLLYPHVGALFGGTTVSCFLESGLLFHTGGRGGL
ncbi:MAG: hypothetical protein JSV83_17695 [Desulfobacterales bacterium]|nr:MAG: hypothetical protein JSV83_17695 [Desulfobacterales bacterium]